MNVVEGPRLALALAARWPRHRSSDALSANQRRLCEADKIRACLGCGGPAAVPDDRVRGYADKQGDLPAGYRYVPDDLPQVERWTRSAGWEIHPDCAAGLDQWGAAWPAIAIATELERTGRLVRPLDGRLAAEIAAACRPCTDCPPPQRQPRLQVPLFVNVPDADPLRPVQPWSFTDTAARGAGAWLWIHPMTGRAVEVDDLPAPPTLLEVIGAELADAHQRLHWSEPVPPSARFLSAGDACWWCGVGRAPRRSWELADGGVWCGRQDVCPPPVVGNPLLNRAQIVGRLLDEPYNLPWIRQAATMRRLPTVVWGELDEAARMPQERPFGWVTDAVLDDLRALFDSFEQNDEHIDARMAAAEADRRAVEAHQREMAEIRSAAVEEARAEAKRVAREEARPPAVDPAEVKEIAKNVAQWAIAENNRQWRASPVQVDALGRPVRPGRRR